MKIVLIAMFTIASFTALAQERYHHRSRQAMDPLTPEQTATLRTKRMTLALDLTQAQQEQVQEFHLKKARFRQEKMETRKDEDSTKSRKELSSDQRFQLQSERLDRMIADKAKMKEILSEEQFEKWERTRQHRKHSMRKGRSGKHGRP